MATLPIVRCNDNGDPVLPVAMARDKEATETIKQVAMAFDKPHTMDTTEDIALLFCPVYGLAWCQSCVSMHRSNDSCSMVERCARQTKVLSAAIDLLAVRSCMRHPSTTSDAMSLALLGMVATITREARRCKRRTSMARQEVPAHYQGS